MAGKTVLVLGGGVGGLVAARRLRKRLGRDDRVVLVDKSARHYFAPSYLWLILGWRKPPHISRDIRRLAGSGVEFIQAEVQGIDLSGSRVKTTAQELSYDYLVVALGAQLAPEMVPGLSEAAHSYYDVESATRLRDALPAFEGGSVTVLIPSLPFKCPAAPYEGALLLDYYFRRRGIRGRIEMQMFTPEPMPMAVAGPVVGDMVKGLLEQRQIRYNPGFRLRSLDPERRDLSFESGENARYDLLVTIPPHRCPAPVRDMGLGGDAGWVSVDKATLQTKVDNVYALGDVTVIPLSLGLPLPKAGVFAHGEAQVVADSIAAEIRGGEKRTFGGEGS